MRKFTLAVLTLAAIQAYGQVDNSRTVVTINGDDVKGAEYYHRMEYLPGVGKQIGSGIVEFPPGFLAIEELITERLVAQLAKKKGVYPSDIELQAELKARQDEDPKLLDKWRMTGQTDQDFMTQLRYETALFKLRTFGVVITDQQVQQRYDTSPNIYSIPKQVQLRVIVVDDPSKKAPVDQALAAGKAFADVAKSMSVDVTKDSGGSFGNVPITVLPADWRAAIEATKKGGVTAWVGGQKNGATRLARFLVEDVTPQKRMTLDASLKRSIRREMMLQAGSVKNDVEKDMREMRKAAKIDITQPEFAKLYDAYVKAYLKEGQ